MSMSSGAPFRGGAIICNCLLYACYAYIIYHNILYIFALITAMFNNNYHVNSH